MRLKLNLPETLPFSTQLKVRVGDLNYGDHLANDRLLGLLHQARLDLIPQLGANSEIDFFGTSLIMGDVAINFKSEAFLNELLTVEMAIADITRVSFDILYRVTCENRLVAEAKTGMVCFNYQEKKVVSVPTELHEKIS
ncbi:acyl-CoA thioesterase [Luteibaculum oceani]|uniref:Acyl-CoA thioesterase n=1 Tax=Luteibaculum oceani TaxID=1294296 RepID=A0A5C6VPL5_9FLAO|nr:thioesterase family protein [Luteibaculum oceani]TXC85198.1 acyl-CoA thioesterase [Luteibaculum oceani]